MPTVERDSIAKSQALCHWYESSVRGFFQEHLADIVAPLDDEVRRLKGLADQSAETVVCFVGASGIGKSTLLNAIVAQEKTVAPSGGVGPLTALATEVRYSDVPRLRAEYHPKKHLWRVAAALNFQVERDRKVQHAEQTGEAELALDEAERKEIEEEVSEVLKPENEGGSRRMDEFLRMARLLVTGSQHEHRETDYLADALSVACAVKARWGTTPTEDDAKRIARIRDALQMAAKSQPLVKEQGADARAFRETLREHAAGFLSPLIQRIEVGWPSDTLKSGLVLVDLPGVGVAGDVYKKETQKFVREKARAVVLVVDRAGPTEPVMEVLRTTGYWDRLLLSSDDPGADPCSLVMAVTRVDDVATEDWYNIDPDEEGRRPRSKSQVFDDVRVRLRDGMRSQFVQQLASFTFTNGDGSGAIRQGRESAGRTLLESLQIHPVSAIEYRRLLADNDDDRPFLREPDQSGVPALTKELVALATLQGSRRAERIRSLSHRIAETIWDQLDTIEAAWLSNRAAEEAERIRAALQVVLRDKKRDFDGRRASFRTFLNQTVPEKIKVAVHEAKDEAQRGVHRYLRALQDAHWATLRAAVQRGGTYYGARHINLPSDIALRFQDPVAAVWSQSLLKDIRKETYTLATDIRQMVEEVCDWASREERAYVDEKVIEAQKKLVSSQVERLRDVGKEAIDELRNVVKVKVVESIERPIRDACEKFVAEGNHIGPGVKARILELFQDLAANATDAASRPTQKTLLKHYETVNAEIHSAFKEWGDPLEAAGNAIVERHEDRVKRSDSQKRGKVLAAIAQARSEGLPRGAFAPGANSGSPTQ
jgi:hypothetical protein